MFSMDNIQQSADAMQKGLSLIFPASFQLIRNILYTKLEGNQNKNNCLGTEVENLNHSISAKLNSLLSVSDLRLRRVYH